VADAERTPPAHSPLQRSLALGLSALVGIGIALAVRGSALENGLVVRAAPVLLARDVAGLLLCALAVGLFSPLIAGNHVPGLPLRALCVAWAGIGLSVRGTPGIVESAPEAWRLLGLAELLALAASAWVTTTTCWLVDTRITFPRLYPNRADRPPKKQMRGGDVVKRQLPHALGIALVVASVAHLVPPTPSIAPDPTLPVFILAFAAALASHTMQRLRPVGGSIWPVLGVLAGLGGAAAAGPPWFVYPSAQDVGLRPIQLLTAAAAGYAAIIARGRGSDDRDKAAKG